MAFSEATRKSDSFLYAIERTCLIWLADRMPPWVNSDHLTLLGLLAMALTGVSYWLAQTNRLALISAIVWLAVNWFGDSLDGTLARVRQRQRPRYGFYVDHVLDTFGALFVVAGLAASGTMSPAVAAVVLIAYYIVSIELYLASYCLRTFQMSFGKFGPTELRILLAIGTARLMVDPTVKVFGASYQLFDVGGAVAAVVLGIVAVVSVARHVRELYLAEPLPAH